jgi:hypothetical protein
MVRSGVQQVIQLTQSYFPKVPIYPALGNHDNWLSDQLPQPPRSDAWFSFIADVWKGSLTSESLETVRYGGYYAQHIKPGLLLISFNSIYCDTSNLWAVLNQTTAHANQFTWLSSTLQAARQRKDKVYIIGHIVPTDYFKVCREAYRSLALDYSDIIVGHFFGDRHTDEIRVIQDDKGDAQGVIYVQPSATTFTSHNPTFRAFLYDPTSFSIVDHSTYWTNISEANNAKNTSQPPRFLLEYSAKAAYSLPDLSPKSWQGLTQRLAHDDSLLDLFAKYYFSSYPHSCSSDCKQKILSDQVWTNGSEIAAVATRTKKESTLCILCKEVMTVVDQLLDEKVADDIIIEQLSRICPIQDEFPERVCWGFFHLYGPYALPVFAIQGDPIRVCSSLKACKS